MGLSFMVKAGDSVRDGAGENVGIGEGTVGELMLLEVAPASFDVVQLRGVFRQPFKGQPSARGERLCGQLAGVDRPVIENRYQGPGAEVWPEVGDGLTGRRRRIVGVSKPPRLQPRSDTPCPMLTWLRCFNQGRLPTRSPRCCAMERAPCWRKRSRPRSPNSSPSTPI